MTFILMVSAPALLLKSSKRETKCTVTSIVYLQCAKHAVIYDTDVHRPALFIRVNILPFGLNL